ncbi:MAG: T9SS type A sorting domain-containing protein [Saprospiraceae bacterium]
MKKNMYQLLWAILLISVKTISAQSPDSCADLALIQLNVLEFTPTDQTISFHLKNIGNQATDLQGPSLNLEDNATVSIYFSRDSILDQSDILHSKVTLGEFPLNPIAAGETFTIISSNPLTLNFNEYHFLIAVANADYLTECSKLNNVKVTPFDIPYVRLSMPSIEADPNGQVALPVFASGFTNMLGMQFSIQLPESSLFHFDSVGSIHLPGLSGQDIAIQNDHLGLIWLSTETNGTAWPGDQPLFYLFFTPVQAVDTCVSVHFDGEFLPIEFYRAQPNGLQAIPYGLESGTMCLRVFNDCSGLVHIENGKPIANALVQLNEFSTYTDATGHYHFDQIPNGVDYAIHVSKGGDYLNGISIADIIAIKQHLLEILPFDSPYKYIAADVSDDRHLSVIDLVLIKRLMLGVIDTLPNPYVWKFIPESYVFNHPEAPLTEEFPVVAELTNPAKAEQGVNFIGVKIGDVTLDARRNLQEQPIEIREAITWEADWDAATLNGPYKTINILAKNDQKLEGLQLSLPLLPGIEILDVESDVLNGFDDQDYYVRKSKSGEELNIVWVNESTAIRTINAGDPVLRLRIRTDNNLSTSDLFTTTKGRMVNMVEDSNNDPYVIRIETRASAPKNNFEINSISPNPANSFTDIALTVPKPGEVEIKIYDMQGRFIWAYRQVEEAGVQRIRVPLASWSAGGYIAQCRMGTTYLSEKFIKVSYQVLN